MRQRSQFNGPRLTDKLEEFLRTRPETPFLAMDGDVVLSKYLTMRACFPRATIYYAVKANPVPDLVALLAAVGAGFDISSRHELDLCLSLNIAAEQLSYGNPIKKADDIAYAYKHGVRCFAFDSQTELEKLAVHAPGAGVICRLLTSGEHADWPLSRKFGCDVEMAGELLLESRNLGLDPLGVMFHVGSQQTDPQQWQKPIREAASIVHRLAAQGIQLTTVNLGGGFPARYRDEIPPLCCYARAIAHAVGELFDLSKINLVLEPGRSLVAEAGVIETEVVLVARKSRRDETRWVYLDVGRFGGLAETLNESIKYRFRTARDGETGPVVLAGPTCDSADILYERNVYALPLDLACGDRIEILSAGAYTSSYASVGFNGFPPLRTYWL